MFKSIGKLLYHNDPYKLIVEVDEAISDYYQSFMPKYIEYNKQRYTAHISVIRKEIIPNMDLWGKYNLQDIEFEYENYIYISPNFFWLNVYSEELENIRFELGMSRTSEITRSPDGRHKFHITLGNFKNLTPLTSINTVLY
jgi:hypothetical protein